MGKGINVGEKGVSLTCLPARQSCPDNTVTLAFCSPLWGLSPAQSKAQGHQPQRVARCGWRAAGLCCDLLHWLDVSVDIDHQR